MNVNVLQSVNSFMGHFGLAISNPKQILAKVTAVAFPVILLVNKLSLVEATIDNGCDMDCWVDCIVDLGCIPREQECIQKCLANCCEEWFAFGWVAYSIKSSTMVRILSSG